MSKRGNRLKVHEPTTEQRVTQKVSQLLSGETVTPQLVYDLMLLGSRCYRQGVGLPHKAVWQALLDGFAAHDRHYLNPYQMAALRGRSEVDDCDFEHLAQ